MCYDLYKRNILRLYKYMPVPLNTIKRLPYYLRVLENLEQEGKTAFSSQDFESRMDINPAVLRKDFSYFGKLGVRGQGYSVEHVKRQMAKLLGISEGVWETVIIGAGNIAAALLRYENFKDINLKVAAAFDTDPQKIGKTISGVPILDSGELEKYLGAHEEIKFVILTVPGPSADEIVERLKETNIRGIINFTPRFLAVSKRIKVVNLNITAKILNMFYYLKDIK